MASSPETAKNIKDVAFRLFLEKGYDGTNQREIAEQAGCTAPAIYFYYHSKQELFLTILKDTWKLYLENMNKLIKDGVSEHYDLKTVFMEGVYSVQKDYATYRFLLRYRLFPVHELAPEIRQLFHESELLEKELYMPFIQHFMKNKDEYKPQSTEIIYYHFIRMRNCLINDMVISGELISFEKIEIHWKGFCKIV